MSNSTRDRSPRGRRDRSPLSAALLAGPLAAAGFWTGVALPFLYVPLLLAGPAGLAQQRVAVALIALHVVALVIGHGHRQDAVREE